MSETIDLNDDDIAFLLALLRTSPQPLTTQQLIDAFRGEPDGDGGQER